MSHEQVPHEDAPLTDAELEHAQRRRQTVTTSILIAVAAAILIGMVVFMMTRNNDRAVPAPVETPAATVEATAEATPTPTATGETTAEPSTTAAPSTASPEPTATSEVEAWTSTTTTPGELGDLQGFRLPHEGETGWAPADLTLALCEQDQTQFSTLADLEAARSIRQDQGEGSQTEAVLVFGSDAQASAFLEQVRTSQRTCAAVPLPEQGEPGIPRTLHESASSDLGDEGILIGNHDESYVDGQWVESPGGVLQHWVRSGRVVLLSSTGGEYVGNIITGRPDVVTEVRQSLEQSLANLPW